VTMLPVLLMQPHEERPRQQLFRQYLLKPCILVMPIWMLLWVVNCFEVVFVFKLLHPFWYFVICHMVLPAVIVRCLMQMQAADEALVLEQRRTREADAACSLPLVIEDPAPTILKELITINPIALLWLGATASIPLLACSLFTPMQTARGKMAQGYMHLVYGPLVIFQVAFVSFLWYLRFLDLPKLYIGALGILLSLPGLTVWCMCLMCASRYGRQDMELVLKQRRERGQAATQSSQGVVPNAATPVSTSTSSTTVDVVDCTEARLREWELIYSA